MGRAAAERFSTRLPRATRVTFAFLASFLTEIKKKI